MDAGKLIKGKKRHILVDMQGLLLHAIVHSAGVQDRDGGIWLLAVGSKSVCGALRASTQLYIQTRASAARSRNGGLGPDKLHFLYME
jgi:hypothetical protein